MNELNSDMVLWMSLAMVALTAVVFIAYAWKTFRSLDSKDD